MFEWLKKLFKKEEKDLAPQTKRMIIIRYLRGESQTDLAKEFGISYKQISKIIISSRTYKTYLQKRETKNGRKRTD